MKPKEREAAEKLFPKDTEEKKMEEDNSFVPGVIKKKKLTAEEKVVSS